MRVNDWDSYGLNGTINEIPFNDLKDIGGQGGLPDANCLAAIYKAIKPPSTPKGKSIGFSALKAVYDKKDGLAVTMLIKDSAFASSGHGAGRCAECSMWDELK